MRAQLLGPDLPDHVRHQPLLSRLVLAHHHRAVGHARGPPQHALDLARLDAEPADLDLLVQPAQVLQRPVGQPPHPVSRAVQPPLAEGAPGEALRRQLRPVQVATRHAAAAHVQLARHPHRERVARRVQHVQPQVGDAHADGASRRPEHVLPGQHAVGDVHGGLGDPVHVHQARPLHPPALHPLAQAGRLQRLAAEDHLAQRQLATALGIRPDELAEGRGRLVEHGDALALHQGVERPRVAAGLQRHHDQAPAVEERAPELPDGEVEGVGVEERPHVRLTEAEPGVGGGEQARHVPVLDQRALRPARGAGGVDDVGQALRPGAGDGIVRGLPLDLVPLRVQAYHGDALRHRERAAFPLRGHQHRHAGVLQHVGQALGRVAGVERHVGAAGLEHGQDGDDHLRAALQADPHPRLGAHAQALEVVGQPVGPGVQRGVGERRALERHRGGVGHALHLRLEELVDADPARVRPLHPVPLLHHLPALHLPQQRDLREARVRIGGHLLHQAREVAEEPLHGRGLPQLRAVGQPPAQPLRARHQAQRQVELGEPELRAHSAHAQPRETAAPAPGGVQRERHLEERRVAQAALRAQLGHQPLERHLLVLVRPQRHLPHPAHQIAEARVPREVGAQHQRVDEEADQLLHLAPPAPGDRAADDHVLARAVPGEQRLEGAQHHHVQRRALLPPQRAQLLQHLRRELDALARAPEALHRRPRDGPWAAPAARGRRAAFPASSRAAAPAPRPPAARAARRRSRRTAPPAPPAATPDPPDRLRTAPRPRGRARPCSSRR